MARKQSLMISVEEQQHDAVVADTLALLETASLEALPVVDPYFNFKKIKQDYPLNHWESWTVDLVYLLTRTVRLVEHKLAALPEAESLASVRSSTQRVAQLLDEMNIGILLNAQINALMTDMQPQSDALKA